MIPLTPLSALPAHTLIRLIIGAAIACALLAIAIGGYAAIKEHGAREVRDELEPRMKVLAAERNAAQAALVRAEREAQLNEESSNAYQQELGRLRDRPHNTGPVRLCRDARVPGLDGAAASGSQATAAAGGVVQLATGTDLGVVPGPDIGPELRGLAKRADELSAQTRAVLQRCEARP